MSIEPQAKGSPFTRGHIGRNIWELSWPTMISMLLSLTPGLLEGVWVGRLGSAALSAAAIGMALRVTMISPLMALSSSAGAVVARYIGAREQRQANLAVLQAVILFVVAAGVMGIVGLAFSRPLLTLSGATGAILPEAVRYVRWLFIGLIAMEMVPSASFMLVAAGSPQLSLRVYLLTSTLAVVLQPLLVLGVGGWPGLGVSGASLGLMLANTAGMIYALSLLLRRRASAWIDTGDLRLDWAMIKRIVRIAAPSVISRGTPNLAASILIRIMSGYGAATVATYTILRRVQTYLVVPGTAGTRSAIAMVGQNLGAEQPARARRAALTIGLAVLAVCTLTLGLGAIWRGDILGLFASEPAVIEEGVQAYGILGLGMLLFTVSLVFENALTGAGDTVSPMVINIIYLWLIQIPLVYAVSRFTEMGSMGIWLVIALSRGSQLVMSFFRFLQGKWQTREI